MGHIKWNTMSSDYKSYCFFVLHLFGMDVNVMLMTTTISWIPKSEIVVSRFFSIIPMDPQCNLKITPYTLTITTT